MLNFFPQLAAKDVLEPRVGLKPMCSIQSFPIEAVEVC